MILQPYWFHLGLSDHRTRRTKSLFGDQRDSDFRTWKLGCLRTKQLQSSLFTGFCYFKLTSQSNLIYELKIINLAYTWNQGLNKLFFSHVFNNQQLKPSPDTKTGGAINEIENVEPY